MSATRLSSPFLRTVSIAALVGASLFISPLTGAYAESAQHAQKSPTAKAATDMKPETVEARITKLHADLKITQDEETRWSDVAKTMRENAARMEKLSADKQAQAQAMTAVDDLNIYTEFAKAHLAGLTDLTASFTTLYNAMPDAQKKNADRVFQGFGRTAQAN